MPKQPTTDQTESYSAKDLMKKRGKTYYWATKLFPRKLREAVYTLYAFYRIPDDIVDTEDISLPEVQQKLHNWIDEWKKTIKSESKNSHPVLLATKKLHKKYQIDYSYSVDFLNAMASDLTKNRYQTYNELCEYMYGSAAVVGIMLSHIIGVKSPDLFKTSLSYATKLGYAMQLTNFLRDIGEDIKDRNRIYLPINELAKFNLTADEIIQNNMPEQQWQAFMTWQVDRAENLYQTAIIGIRNLKKVGQFPVLLAANLYGYQLQKIRNNNYKIIGDSNFYRPTFWEKVKITFKTYYIYKTKWQRKKQSSSELELVA